MGLGDAYQESTDTALRVMASRPIEPDVPKPKHSAWTTIHRAVTAAAAEVGGNLMDVAGAYGQVSAAYGQNQPIPDTKQERQQRIAAFDKLQTEGINWRTDESKQAYSFARDLRPDPLTAGTAENIFFGLTKGLTKAIGSGVMLGPVGGAATFGTSEGMTTAEDLAVQGVDQTTRTKVGATVGVLNAAGMALPVAGKTLAETAALVAVGGPGSFIAQQQATRSILENANYHEMAQQYDPLDPTGIALATLLPAGFAAWAKGGAIKAAMAGKQKTPESSGPAPTSEQVDALMAHNLTANADHRPMHERAELLKAWDEVHQNPIGDANDPLVRLTPDDISHVLVERGPVSMKDDGVSIKVPGYGLVKFIWRHGPESSKPETGQINSGDLADFPYIMRNYEPGRTVTNGVEQMTWVTEREDGRLVVFGTSKFADDKHHHLVTVHVDEKRTTMPSIERKEPPSTSGQGTLQASRLDTPSESFASSSPEVDGGHNQIIGNHSDSAKFHSDQHINSVLSRIEDLKGKNPDMPVALREDGQPVRLADELDAIRRQAKEGTADELGAVDAPLLKVAAECFLAMGSAA